MDQRRATPTAAPGPVRRPWHRLARRGWQPERDEQDAAENWLRAAPLWLRSGLAAAGAAAASAALVVCVVFIGWMAAAYSTGTGGQATATGFAAWLLTHGVPLDAGFGPLNLVPWLLTLLPLTCCVWAAQWVLSSLPQRAETRLPNLGGIRQDVVIAAGAFAVGYALASTLFALLARASAPAPIWPAAALFPPVIAVLGFAEALRSDGGVHLGSLAPRAAKLVRARLPLWWGTSVRSGLWAAGALFAVGLLTTSVLVVAQWSRVTAVFHTLHTGALGGVLIIVGTLLYSGTAAMWVTSWLAGPGFSLGVGSSVTLAEVQPGPVPPVPILGVLPEPGPLPAALWLLVLVPVVAGAIAGYRATRTLTNLAPWRLKAASAGTAALVAGAVLTALGAISSGSLGSGQLAWVGIPVGWFALAVTAELLLGALLSAFVAHRLRTPRIN